MPEVGRGGLGGRGGRGGGAGWAKIRATVRGDDGAPTRRPNLLASMGKMTSFRISQSQRHIIHRNRGVENVPEEEGGDLHKHFRTCPSLTRIREELRNAMSEDAEKRRGFGLNACARPEESTGRLLLHCLGLNSDLITSGGGAAAAQSRVNQFVMQELLPAFPSAIVEEDDKGMIPFTEPIVQWIEARRAVRKWKLDTDRSREKVALVAQKLQRRMGQAAAKREYHSDSDSEDSISVDGQQRHRPISRRSRLGSFLTATKNDEKQARMELKMIVDSSDDAMFCIDERGTILLTNHAALKQFGYEKKEMMGKNISMICNTKDAMNHDGYLSHYIETGEKKVMGKKREVLARKKDGSTFSIELGITEVNLGNGHFIFCGFVKDVTEVKKHRQSLEYTPRSSFYDDNSSNENDHSGGGGGGNRGSSRTRGIPPLVEWCLTILSEFVDNSDKIGNAVVGEDDDDSSIDNSSSMDNSEDFKASFSGYRMSFRALQENTPIQMRDTMVVDKVASIPHLLEELLLIDDQEARSRLFDTSIVHKVLFSQDSLGDGKWLIQMLDKSIRVQKQKYLDANLSGADVDTAEGRAYQLQLKMAQDECRFLAEGAIFYLEQVSELNIQDDLYVFHNVRINQEVSQNGGMADMISTGDVHHFEKARNELFDAVGGLNGLVRRICVLEDDLVKRAAATPVIRRLLDKIMFSPFATLAALFDGINHFLLMISFRLGPAPALFHLAKNDSTFQPHHYLLASATLISSISYFGTKAVHAGLAKHALSENLFWSDAFTFWSLLDTVPLLMCLLCSIAVDMTLRQRVYAVDGDYDDIPFLLRTGVAITTPLLWLRILAFVKVRNKQLATFILCTVEIMKDIKWFLLVLFAAMASFAQMWVSLTFEPHQSESEIYMEGYLKAYTMMLGDLDSDALRTHPLIAVLFVVYTFGVTVVLLNVLIAIVSDSYQNSFVSSKMMLGKARVIFVSELLSLKTFHQMWMEGKTGNTRRNVNYIFGAISVIHLWRITGTVIKKLGQGTCDGGILKPNALKIEAALAFILLFGMLFVMKVTIAYVLNHFNDTGGLKTSASIKPSSWFQRTVIWFVQTAFSALSSSFDSLFDREDEQGKFGTSQTAHESHRSDRSDKALQKSIEKTRKHLKAEFKSMFDQMQLSLREMEDKQQDITNSISSAIGDLQQLMIQSTQIGNIEEVQNHVINGEDKSHSSRSSSQSSLSLEQVGLTPN